MPIIKRILSDIILPEIEKNEEYNDVLLIAGARQVGKTTLITQLLKDKKNISVNLLERTTLPALLDMAETFEELEKILWREINFRPSQGTILVFDEAQEAKRLGRWLRFFKEKWAHQKVIVSGSILSNLFSEDVAYPVGRVREIVVRPFTFKEYLTAANREGLYEILEAASLNQPISDSENESLVKPYLDYISIGGMPANVMSVLEGTELPYTAWDRLGRQYALDVERYMGENFRTLFISALDRIADTTCHPIKNSQIVSSDSPSYRTLPALLELMEKWHLIHRVSAQTKHPESSGGLTSKKYLFDVGMTNFFINRSQPVYWKNRPPVGNLIFPKLQENFVCNELIAISPAPITTLNYYKETRNSREIDFVLPIAYKLVPIEVKSQTSIGMNSLTPMINFLEQRNLTTGILIYNGNMRRIGVRGKIIYALPPFLISELPKLAKHVLFDIEK